MTNSPSDTPRVDAMDFGYDAIDPELCIGKVLVDAGFARQLERELTEAKVFKMRASELRARVEELERLLREVRLDITGYGELHDHANAIDAALAPSGAGCAHEWDNDSSGDWVCMKCTAREATVSGRNLNDKESI